MTGVFLAGVFFADFGAAFLAVFFAMMKILAVGQHPNVGSRRSSTGDDHKADIPSD